MLSPESGRLQALIEYKKMPACAGSGNTAFLYGYAAMLDRANFCFLIIDAAWLFAQPATRGVQGGYLIIELIYSKPNLAGCSRKTTLWPVGAGTSSYRLSPETATAAAKAL